MLNGHGGNIHEAAKTAGCHPSEIMDLSSNISPLPLPRELLEKLRKSIHEIGHLPEVGSKKMVGLIAERYGLSKEQILVGNGTTEFIYSIPSILNSGSALILGPTYSDYADSCAFSSVKTNFLFSQKEEKFIPDLDQLEKEAGKSELVFLCNPNNPTGSLIPGEEIRKIIRRFLSTLFVVDESYLPFVPNEEEHSLLKNTEGDNLIVLRSFSKIYAMPGLRLGWLAASEKMVNKLRERAQPWTVNRMAQIAGEILLESSDYAQESATYIAEEREHFLDRLRSLLRNTSFESLLVTYPASANFILLELQGAINAPILARAMTERRILIRDCSNFKGLDNRFVRMSLKSQKMNDSFLEALKNIIFP